MFSKLSDSAIEWLYCGRGSGKHDAAFHHDQKTRRQRIGIGSLRQPVLHLMDALADRCNPALKVFRDELMCGTVLRVDFAPGRGRVLPEPVRVRKDERSHQLLDRPAVLHKTRGEVIQQFRVGGRLAGGTEIVHSGDDSPAEQVLPDAVDHDSR